MNKEIFIAYANRKKIEFKEHPSDKKFLILLNCSFNKGAELCKEFKASGMSSGKNSEDFQIGNFGKYN